MSPDGPLLTINCVADFDNNPGPGSSRGGEAKIVIMDPTVTWEILSRLSKSGSDNSFPFFAQRQVASATDVDTCTNNSQCHWFMTCPPIQGITSSSSTNAPSTTDNAVENNNINTSAAEAVSTTILYSQDAIIQEFLYVLQKQNDGRISASEMSIKLGMEEDKIVTIGNILCSINKLSSSPATNKCCKVYNPTKKQYEYALVEKLQCTLRDRIDVLCNTKLLDSTFLDIEPEKIIMDQSSILVPISTVTVNQLSHELKISCDNITKLLEDIRENLPTNITISKRGTVIEVYTCSYEYRMEYLEKHILSGLGGVTVPTSVCMCLSVCCA